METAIQPNKVREIGTLHASDIFGKIYLKNGWIGNESMSGPGSDVARCESIIHAIPELFTEFNIMSMLDIPCGDLNWIRHVDFTGVKYTGADIVIDLIHDDFEKYDRADMHFLVLNIIQDQLPACDLILCRDCLVHFSIDDIKKTIVNIIKSKAKYLLCTTFTNAGRENKDMVTGHWRPLNMEDAPFNFPAPLKMIKEDVVGEFADKSLGLWNIEELIK